MEINETFRANLLRIMEERGMSEAELSVKAGKNKRAVTDIRERRSLSPKLSTVFEFADALGVSPLELLGLEPRSHLNPRLTSFLGQYSEEEQDRLLAALELFALREK